MTAGERLRTIREQLGLSLRAVEAATARLVIKYGNPDYLIAPSRLSDIETKGVLPNLYRLYALAVIYRRDFHEVLEFYGINFDSIPEDAGVVNVAATHQATVFNNLPSLEVPVRLEPAFDPKSSVPMGRMILKWGTAPLSYLKTFAANRAYTYGYVGTDDWTMYPLIMPGSFVQVDETRQKVTREFWKSEYERPIFFVETRQGHTCCWCELDQSGRMLILKPHPMSPAETRILKYGSEVEIIGQVVGVAMRLDGWAEPVERAEV